VYFNRREKLWKNLLLKLKLIITLH
jgi:hypothetical protein